MRWLIFGDDWGRHPSTTQHLARALPEGDKVIWVDSLGMRAPRLQLADLQRVAGRLRPAPARPGAALPGGWSRLRPRLAPWHAHRGARGLNRQLLGARLRRLLGDGPAPTVLAANPVAAWYVDAVAPRAVGYLRLDDYAELPGVDPALAQAAEAAMVRRADVVFGTAPALVGSGEQYLPQGVDAAHFGRVTRQPPKGRTIGFFGLFAEWIDAEFIAAVADAAPEWTFEFLGPTRVRPAALEARPNVVFRDAVPYAELPDAIGHWAGAWLPFKPSALSDAVNPLKAREYLAAGLPSAGRGLPTLKELPAIQGVESVDDVVRWLWAEVAPDSAERRAARRASVADQTWAARAARLRAALAA